MKLPGGFGDVDFEDWIRGLISAFISGGAVSVVSGVVVTMNDPKQFAPGTVKFLTVVGSVFLASGTLNMFAFLRQRPIPSLKKVESTVQTIEVQGKPASVVTTVKETVTVPIPEAKP